MKENLKIEGIFKIQVKMIQGSIFTFNDVEGYVIEPGDFISFQDTKTKEFKKFHASHCEIQEIKKGVLE